MTCPVCGLSAIHGDLIVAPPRVLWKGKRVPGLQPSNIEVLAVLARRQFASQWDLSRPTGSKSPKAIGVHIHDIRNAFREANIPVTVSNHYGEGYSLSV